MRWSENKGFTFVHDRHCDSFTTQFQQIARMVESKTQFASTDKADEMRHAVEQASNRMLLNPLQIRHRYCTNAFERDLRVLAAQMHMQIANRTGNSTSERKRYLDLFRIARLDQWFAIGRML